MKIEFKIFNPEVIDCSSCHNTIYPDPESRDILLNILLKVCESNRVVAAIGKFTFRLDNIELHSPNIYGIEYKQWKKDDSKYGFQSGKEAKLNKIAGLFVEKEEDARERLQRATNAYYIEPGLNGIRKAIQYIKLLYDNKRENLPEHLKDIKVRHFSYSMGVIWKMNEHWSDRGGYYDHINYEHDYIGGGSSKSGFGFGFGNFGGDSLDIFSSEYYLNHLDAIQEILDKVAPGKYEADPDQRENLIKSGFLKREDGKHIIPDEKEVREMEKRFNKLELERIRSL